MPRPRRPFSGQENVITADVWYLKDEAPGKLGTRQAQRWQTSANWTYPVPNGITDPLTYMLVVDALLTIDRSIELRAKPLTGYLADRYTQLTWDTVTVGRVLADLAESLTERLGKANTFLAGARDGRGWFYVMQGSPEAAAALYGLRDDLQRLTQERRDQLANRQDVGFKFSPLVECPSLRGEFVAVD